METKKASKILATALSFAAIAVYGCGGGGGGGGGGGTTTTTTPITSAPQAADAGASGVQSSSVSSNVGQSLSNIAAVGTGAGAPKYRSPLVGKDTKFNKMHAAEVKAMKGPASRKAAFLRKAKAASTGSRAPVSFPGTPEPCGNGTASDGTVTITGTYDDATFAYNMTMTFVNCREEGSQYNGTITSTGTFSSTSDSFNMTMGDGDSVIESAADFKVDEFTDSSYTNLFATYIADMTMSGSGAVGADSYSFTFTANGKEQYSDFIDTFNMTFTSLQFASVASYNDNGTPTDYSDDTFSGSDTANGGFSETWTENSATQGASITFTNLITTWNSTSSYYDFSVDGTVVMDFTPNDLCFEGTFVIDTTTPVRYDYTAMRTTQGRIVINTNTAIVFNADGTVTVELDGQAVAGSTNVPLETLENACPIEDFEEDTSSETTFGNSTSISGTVTGASSLLATLSWDKANDMDLHLNYYNVDSPNATSQLYWYVDYHTGFSNTANGMSSCLSPLDGVSYWAGIDSNGDGTCEIGLDYDITENDGGYGPEHITATTLPAGYYVLSVNSYTLYDAQIVPVLQSPTVITVTINIGGNVFTFPSHTFTVEDFEGTTSSAWYRVCDIHVTSDGTAHIMEPEPALSPWHTGTYGLTSPKKRR